MVRENNSVPWKVIWRTHTPKGVQKTTEHLSNCCTRVINLILWTFNCLKGRFLQQGLSSPARRQLFPQVFGSFLLARFLSYRKMSTQMCRKEPSEREKEDWPSSPVWLIGLQCRTLEKRGISSRQWTWCTKEFHTFFHCLITWDLPFYK